MNIKLVKIEDRWFVVVNSVTGEFREDVTAQIKHELCSQYHQEAIKLLKKNEYAKLKEIKEAAEEAFNSLANVMDLD